MECQTCHVHTSGGAVAKDFTHWSKDEATGFWEPSTIRRDVSDTKPVYAWFNGRVRNEPHLIAPKGSRQDPKSRITPFKVYEGRAYYDAYTGKLLSMDFAQPTATGDTLAGVASAARTLGIARYRPVPSWQKIYFANSHLVTRAKALTCDRCHTEAGHLDFESLGYQRAEVKRRKDAPEGTPPGLKKAWAAFAKDDLGGALAECDKARASSPWEPPSPKTEDCVWQATLSVASSE